MSPSARKVWIEILPVSNYPYSLPSPSARKVWIEIFDYDKFAAALVKSPSARKVWIEIPQTVRQFTMDNVTFRKEGVD